MRPDQLGSYLIEAELGSGGMGTVYRARHRESGAPVAIKVLAAQLARDPGFLDRFAREISALQKLHHPGIVRLIESGEQDGLSY